jgi:hypothetical protein
VVLHEGGECARQSIVHGHGDVVLLEHGLRGRGGTAKAARAGSTSSFLRSMASKMKR